MWAEPAHEMEKMSVVPTMTGAFAAEAPVQRNSPGVAQERWANHGNDEAGAPLTGTERTGYAQEDTEATGGQVKDPNLHEQYLGGDRPISGTSHTPDGFAREHTQGGWAQ